MTTQVQFRRGTSSENDSFTGLAGELTINTGNHAIRVHDATVAGGHEMMLATASNITGNIPFTNISGTVNADTAIVSDGLVDGSNIDGGLY